MFSGPFVKLGSCPAPRKPSSNAGLGLGARAGVDRADLGHSSQEGAYLSQGHFAYLYPEFGLAIVGSIGRD